MRQGDKTDRRQDRQGDRERERSIVWTVGIAMRPDMLLHIVLARKGLITDRTEHTLLARVFLSMASCMS